MDYIIIETLEILKQVIELEKSNDENDIWKGYFLECRLFDNLDKMTQEQKELYRLKADHPDYNPNYSEAKHHEHIFNIELGF